MITTKVNGPSKPLILTAVLYFLTALVVCLGASLVARGACYDHVHDFLLDQNATGAGKYDSAFLSFCFGLSALALMITPLLLLLGLGGRYPVNRTLFNILFVFFASLGISRAFMAAALWMPVLLLTEVFVLISSGVCVATASVSYYVGRMLRDLPTEGEIHEALSSIEERRKSRGCDEQDPH